MKPALSLGDAAGPPAYPSLADAILDGVERFRDGRFLYVGRDGQTLEVSYRQTLAEAKRLIAGLREDGLQAGHALLVSLADPQGIVPAFWAAAIGGFVAIPSAQAADWSIAGLQRPENIAFLKETFGDFRLLADTEVAAEAASLVFPVDRLAPLPASFDLEPVAGRAEDLRFAISTSGTTGRPRLVGLSDRAALARWWPQLPDAAHARAFLSWSSFDHVMGLGLAMPNLPVKVYLDAACFIADPLSWLDVLEATGTTHATMTNFGMTLVSQAVAENPDRAWRLERVRKIGVGAESISRRACERFHRHLAAFGLHRDALILGYGLSECGPVVGGGTAFGGGGSGQDAPPELDRPTSGHAVRIVGERGSVLCEGEIGGIEVRGPTMTSGYLGDAAGTAALFTPDGWLRTGDLGLLREGKLTVVGREKELVVVNAKKHTCVAVETAVVDRSGFPAVYVAPLEADTGAGIPGVGAPCAVFVVVDRPGELAPKDVAAAVRAATAEAFRFAPRIVALVSPNDLPRTSLGKIRRLALPSLLAELESRGQVDHLAQRSSTTDPQPGGTGIETRLARIWRDLLRAEGEIDRDADFFALGGDSLLALRLTFLIEEEFGVSLRLEELQAKLSLSELARFLSDRPGNPHPASPLSASDPRLPDWFGDRIGGLLDKWPGTPALPRGLIRRVGAATRGVPVFWCMQLADEARHFGRTVGAGSPAYAMRSGVGLLDYGSPTAAALVNRYVDEIKEICHDGPVVVGGMCQGVIIALAVTRRLVAQGREVRLLAAADCRFADICGASPVPVPVVLFSAAGSRFNPHRSFSRPEIGLRKLAPRGLRLELINASYGTIMVGAAIEHLASRLEAALVWAASAEPPAGTGASPAPAAMYHRRIMSRSTALLLQPGETHTLAVKVKNTSPVAWEPFETSGLALANHWLSSNGGMLIWADGHAPLRRRLEPDGRAHVKLDVVAPQAPGDYLLEVDLVEEGIRWFADVTSAPLQIPVRVVGSPPGGGGQPLRSPIVTAIHRLAGRRPS